MAGGVFNSANLSVYSYGHQRPLIAKDLDGNFVFITIAVVGAAITAYDTYQTYKEAGGGSEGLKAAGKTLAVDGAITLATGGVGKLAHNGYKAYKRAQNVGDASNGANSSVNGVKLEKQLASEEQLSQLAEGGGTVISQPAKQADRIASETGRNPADIQKVSSDARIAKDGQQMQTHSFRDASTNELIEPKTIINDND